MDEDPIVAEVRRVREAYAAKFDYDIGAMLRDLRERYSTSGYRFVAAPKRLAPAASPLERENAPTNQAAKS
jgi:hypothetical protein